MRRREWRAPCVLGLVGVLLAGLPILVTREAKIPVIRLGAGVARLADSGSGLLTVADSLMAGAETNKATTRRPVLVGTISDASHPIAMGFDPRGGILSANDASGSRTIFWNVTDLANPAPAS